MRAFGNAESLIPVEEFHRSAVSHGSLYCEFAVVIGGVHEKSNIDLSDILHAGSPLARVTPMAWENYDGRRDGYHHQDEQHFDQSHSLICPLGRKRIHLEISLTRRSAKGMFV
jgi:hypothetical protein